MGVDCLRENWTVGMFLNSNMAIAGSSVATGWYLTFLLRLHYLTIL